MRTRTLRDAGRAAKSLGSAIGGPQKAQAETIGNVLEALEDRLTAIEHILRTLAQKGGVSLDDVVQTLSDQQTAAQARAGQAVQPHIEIPSAVVRRIRRILE